MQVLNARAKVESDQGQVVVPVYLTEDMMCGVVCLMEGAWAKIDSEGMDSVGSVMRARI